MSQIKYLIAVMLHMVVMGQEPKVYTYDINKDGYKDKVTSYFDGGSGFGGTFVKIVNGKTKEVFELDNSSSFGDIKKVILIPQALRKPANKTFLEEFKQELLPIKRDMPDPSLQWLIEAHRNSRTLSNHIYFDLVLKPNGQWVKGPVSLPDTYYIDVKGNGFQKLLDLDKSQQSHIRTTNIEGWLIYYGHNHLKNSKNNSLVLAASSPTYRAFKTMHGVVVKKGELYKWVLVTDYSLTGAPEKLRWESIGKISIVGKYLFVQLVNSIEFNNPIVIIDMKNGFGARLKSHNENIISYKLSNDQLVLDFMTSKQSYELKKLLDELNKL